MITRFVLKFVLFFVFILSFACPGFAVTNTVPCDYASISAACAAAKKGDIVLIQAGTCTISNTIPINDGVTMRGAGTNLTTLISAPGLQQVFQTSSVAVSDLNCVGDIGNTFGFFVTWRGIGHYYNIQMTNILYRGIDFEAGGFGLVDHCTFASQGGNCQPISVKGSGYVAWASTSNPIGTISVVCVEDCYFDATHSANSGSGQGNGFFDAYDGAQLVFRHNYCVANAPTGVHGYDSQPTSARTWEIYANIFTNMTIGGGVLSMRGGTGVVFSNQVYGAGSFCQLAYFRACATNHLSTALNYGVPGQGCTLTFSSNFTDGQQLKLGGTTSYFFYNTYNSGGNWQGDGGYGGGNVVIGATLAASLSNLMACINQGAGAGTIYNKTLSVDSGHAVGFGHDFLAIGVTANSIILTNALDGNTDQYGYPANQQEGVLVSHWINASNFRNVQTIWPAYAWGNTLNGSPVGFELLDAGVPGSIITNLLKEGRDYSNAVPSSAIYTPLVYPHPLQALEENEGIASSTKVIPPSSLIAVPPR